MMIGVARRVRELGAHLLSTRSTAASIGTVAHALRGRRAFRVTRRHMVAMALLLQAVMAASSVGSGGGCGCWSGRSTAAPSPPVLGASACSRARSVAAIWQRTVLVHMRLKQM